jgi:hypothetical protein
MGTLVPIFNISAQVYHIVHIDIDIIDLHLRIHIHIRGQTVKVKSFNFGASGAVRSASGSIT